jgi:hypothetical protein
MKKIFLPILGVVIGLTVYYLLAWTLNETTLGEQIIAAGVSLWLLCAFGFAGSVALTVILGMIFSRRKR